MKFTELDLEPEVLAGLKDMGYTDLTPVQEQTLGPILAGRDLIARAETGSGKTSACAIPLVQAVDPSQNQVQALILVPTRELALQYVQEIADIARQTKVEPFAVYGGFSMEIQISKLTHGVHILVATPGRLIDLIYNSPLSLANVRTFVLDEADEMLNMGFIDDVKFILSCLIHDHQTLLFSATMPTQIKKLANEHLKDPITIELNVNQIAPQNLSHQFYSTSHNQRLKDLLGYLQEEKPAQAIIFCNSRHGGEKLSGQLSKQIDSVDFIHGGLEQTRRTSLFNRFRKKEISIMVATDVASRGLDFSHVSHVINYDFPASTEAYTHRTGRTARMGRSGTAITFFTSHDLRALRAVIQSAKINPIWIGPEPNLKNVGGKAGANRRRYHGPSKGSAGKKNARPRQRRAKPNQ
ncbi:MAG: DEAD/DEAH box helicase [Sedimentisphaerales bacterium]|nr:DEAD/DEAH box helicase [Sedimentisphaerales bacterium]